MYAHHKEGSVKLWIVTESVLFLLRNDVIHLLLQQTLIGFIQNSVQTACVCAKNKVRLFFFAENQEV